MLTLYSVIPLPTNKIITRHKMVTQETTITTKTNITVLEITLNTHMVDLPTEVVTLAVALEGISPNKALIDDSRALVHTIIIQRRHSAAGEGISTTCNGQPRGLGAVVANIAPDLIPGMGHRLPIDPTTIQNLQLQVNMKTTLGL